MTPPPLKLLAVGGARPNFMKLAPLVQVLRDDPDFDLKLVHTGQHYDDRMSGSFFRELNLPQPDHSLAVGSGSHATQTAEIMRRFEEVVNQEKPRGVIVVGDVNSTLAAAIVAKKAGCAVIHVEAGLRSFDRSMPEEINRLVTDSISDLFLVTEESGLRNLLREGAEPARVVLTGNLMIDSLLAHLDRARRESTILKTLNVPEPGYGLVTLHRPANVDDAEKLDEILGALDVIAETLPLYFPVHPRTRQRLEQSGGLARHRAHVTDPLGYSDFLTLMASARLVLTDSGGIQEETTALRVPCLTLRENTERPATIFEGTNRLAGTTHESILRAWGELHANPPAGTIPRFWDGSAAERCRRAIRGFFSLP